VSKSCQIFLFLYYFFKDYILAWTNHMAWCGEVCYYFFRYLSSGWWNLCEKMIECSDSEPLGLTLPPWGLQQCQRTRISLGHWKTWQYCQVNEHQHCGGEFYTGKFNNAVQDFNVWNAIWLERLVSDLGIFDPFVLIETGICCLDLSLIWYDHWYELSSFVMVQL